MASGYERLTRANRLAHLESILDLLATDSPTVPHEDSLWLVDLLAPVATQNTSFRIAPAQHRERAQGLLLDALGSQYRDKDDPAITAEITAELERITGLFNYLRHHEHDPLSAEHRQTLDRVVRLIRQHLLNENATPRRPSLR